MADSPLTPVVFHIRRRRFALTPLGRRALEAEARRLIRLARVVRDKGLGPREV